MTRLVGSCALSHLIGSSLGMFSFTGLDYIHKSLVFMRIFVVARLKSLPMTFRPFSGQMGHLTFMTLIRVFCEVNCLSQSAFQNPFVTLRH